MRKAINLLLALLLPALAISQAVDLTFQMPSVGGIRHTSVVEEPNIAPLWGTTPATFDFVQNTPASVNLAQYCSDTNGDALTITVASGTPPTGLSLTDGVMAGTPSVVSAPPLTFACSDGALSTTSSSITFNVAAPGTPDDSTPDPFPFAPKVNQTRGAQVTSDPVTFTGINIAATVTVSAGCTWDKNGSGTFVSTSGTVLATNTGRVRGTASVNYATPVQCTLTVGGVPSVFTFTTEASPTRVGIIYRNTWETFSANIVNPDPPPSSEWPVGSGALTDGMGLRHLGMSIYNRTDGREHLVIRNTNPSPVPGFARSAVLTLYDDLNYQNNGYQSADKPRVDLRPHTAMPHLLLRTRYIMCESIYLFSDYVEETNGGAGTTESLIQNHQWNVDANDEEANAWALIIKGASSGASWSMRVNLGTDNDVITFSKAISNTVGVHKGAWNYPCVEWRADNRTVAGGGTPLIRFWLNDELIGESTTQPFGHAPSLVDYTFFSFNLYKYGWRGNGGTYTGIKTGSTRMAYGPMYLGDATSSYQDVHPLRHPQP